MIDIFNELYSKLSDRLTSFDSKIKTSSVYTNTPSSYPFVSMEEISDSIYTRGVDSENIENFVNKNYELNVYTQNPNKKSKADKILSVIDDYFTNLGFIRTSNMPLPTGDEAIYRVVLRYSGVVSKNKIVYWR